MIKADEISFHKGKDNPVVFPAYTGHTGGGPLSSSLMTYPAPRTVCISFVSKPSSTFFLRYLIIRDNFLDRENGVYCALFDSAGNLLYGTHVGAFPISADGTVHTFSRSDRDYYVYSHPLSGEGLDGLIIQGVVEKDANRFLLDGLFSEALLILPALALLAVGGGSVIDCCKIVAAQAKTDEDLWEMEMENRKRRIQYTEKPGVSPGTSVQP